MDVPDYLARLDRLPGAHWTPSEVRQVTDWWLERKQLVLIGHYAARYLGDRCTSQDVEDATIVFFTLLEEARRSYQPNDMGFACYLMHVCFKRHCVREGERIRKRRMHECSIDLEPAQGAPNERQLPDIGAEADPFRALVSRQIVSDVRRLLCESDFPEKQRQAFELRHFECLTIDEIAARMSAPIGSVKAWLNRATGRLRKSLTTEGWS